MLNVTIKSQGQSNVLPLTCHRFVKISYNLLLIANCLIWHTVSLFYVGLFNVITVTVLVLITQLIIGVWGMGAGG